MYLALIVLGSALLAALTVVIAFFYYVIRNYLPIIVRIFEEKPFFRARKDKPIEDAEEFRVPTTDGLTLAACLVRSSHREKKGLVVFAPEFGGTRWNCVHYAGHLLAEGYDLFAFDFRNQGESDRLKDYHPLQYVTQHELADVRAVLAFLKDAPFCPPDGVAYFGVSRGGSTGIVACAGDPFVKCITTDGAFGTVATMTRFMLKWVGIYSDRVNLQRWLPNWFYGVLAVMTLRVMRRRHGLRFPSVRNSLRRLRQQILMVHGGSDSYILPDIAMDLYRSAPKSRCRLWMVEDAKHNQAIDVAEDEYKLGTSQFFLEHYQAVPVPQSSANVELEPDSLAAGPNFSPA